MRSLFHWSVVTLLRNLQPFILIALRILADGNTPGDVSDIASTSTSGAALATASFLSRGAFTGVAVAMLVVVSSAVTFFA